MNTERERNIELLKKSAVELFKEYGYNNVSVNQLCAKAGVARSSFYSMFSDKDDLIVKIYSVELTKMEDLMEQFALQENDFERMWLLYNYYIELAMSSGPDVSAAMMIIELNRNIGIYDMMQKIRKWLIPLCRNCQRQGIITNKTDAEELIPMVSAALNNLVFEWCRNKGEYPLREFARKTVLGLFEVPKEYTQSDNPQDGIVSEFSHK